MPALRMMERIATESSLSGRLAVYDVHQQCQTHWVGRIGRTCEKRGANLEGGCATCIYEVSHKPVRVPREFVIDDREGNE